MHALSRWLTGLFVSPAGIVVLAALDSTVFFSLPFGIDAAVVLVAVRLHKLAWIVPLLATSGSLAGAWLTFWMGMKIGEKGLDRFVPSRRLARIRHRIDRTGAIGLALLDLIPPPFPYTAFILASGALEVAPRTFFVTLAACRLLRFGVEAVLGALYGTPILSWLNADLFADVVALLLLAALVAAVLGVFHIRHSTKSIRARRAA